MEMSHSWSIEVDGDMWMDTYFALTVVRLHAGSSGYHPALSSHFRLHQDSSHRVYTEAAAGKRMMRGWIRTR